jgi:hypothetical protein
MWIARLYAARSPSIHRHITEAGGLVQTVEIPAFRASTGEGLPEVCVRHGEPASQYWTGTVVSRIPWWAFLLIPFGGIFFAIVVRNTRREVGVRSWPFCARCLKARNLGRIVGFAMLGAGVLAFVPVLLRDDSPSGADPVGMLAVAGIVVALAGGLVAARSTLQIAARAEASRDGNAVVVRRPHERFVARAAELVAAERQQDRAGSLFPHRA